jgi:hypothetical protein
MTFCMLVGVAVATAWAGGPDDLPAEARLGDLLQERVVVAEKAAAATKDAYEAGAADVFRLIDAVNKLADARLAIATTEAERIKALEARVAALAEVERKVEALHKEGSRGGEPDTFHTVRRERQTAEIALVREKLLAQAGP